MVKSKSLNSLSTIGSRVYHYIEYVLGMNEDGRYEPLLEDNTKALCRACLWSEDGSRSRLGTFFSEGYAMLQVLAGGFRVCGL